MSYRVRGFSYNTYSTYNTYNNTTKKECPERHSLIFDLQRGFLPAKNFVGGGKTRSPENLYGGGKTSLAKKLYNKSYFEAGRSPRKRSILNVCEHSEDKPDAKRALLDGFL